MTMVKGTGEYCDIIRVVEERCPVSQEFSRGGRLNPRCTVVLLVLLGAMAGFHDGATKPLCPTLSLASLVCLITLETCIHCQHLSLTP